MYKQISPYSFKTEITNKLCVQKTDVKSWLETIK